MTSNILAESPSLSLSVRALSMSSRRSSALNGGFVANCASHALMDSGPVQARTNSLNPGVFYSRFA